MKIVELKARLNACILIAVFIFNAFYQSELGGPGSMFNKASAVALVLFICINKKIDATLLFLFSIPILFLLLSVFFNLDHMSLGSYNSSLATCIGVVLLMLNAIPLDRVLLRNMALIYLFAALVLSLWFLFQGSFVTGNTNFNINVNSAALFFFVCLVLSIIFANGFLLSILCFAFSVLILSTGSRAGFFSMTIVLIGFVFFGAARNRLDKVKKIVSQANNYKILFFCVALFLLVVFLSETFSYLIHRLQSSGISLSSRNTRGLGRDEIWAIAYSISTSSIHNILVGTGPATGATMLGGGSNGSYVEAMLSVGWPFIISLLIAIFYLLFFHMKYENNLFRWFGIAILFYGITTTELFRGPVCIWWLFIFLSIYYHSFNPFTEGICTRVCEGGAANVLT